MSYFRSKNKGLRDDKMASSLADRMYQGNQPKHACSCSLTTAMGQGKQYPGDKGTCYETLGGVMGQGGGKKRG